MNKKKVNFLCRVLAVVMLIMSMNMNVFAAEVSEIEPDNREYLVVNGVDIVYVGEDYDNPETGEYVHWDMTRGTDKSFSFNIRYSLTTSSFTVHSSKVKVTANAHVEDIYGNYSSGYDGHLYTVSIVGIYSRNLQFSVGGTQSGTITGLNNGGSYKVQITNNDYLDSLHMLVGDGTVKTL